MSVRKSSHGTIFLIVSSGSPRALIASSLRSTSKKPFCPITRPLHPPMTAHGHRVRFVATWREEFLEVPSWCFHAVGSSNAPLLGSTAAEGLPRIGRTSIATHWRSCGLPQSASCSENFVITPDVFGQTLSLTVSQIFGSVPSRAAWATRERRCQSGHQSPSHRCNRVRNVAFRPQRRILWAGNLRVRQIAGRAWWHDLPRGESSLARRSGIRTPQCKGWRDGESRANPVLQNVPD